VPSLEENRELWSKHPWDDKRGEEWSRMWGGTPYGWWGSLYPRLHEFLPTGTLLEIAPGAGRWTRFLVHLCDRLIGVDLVAESVERCRRRFGEHPHVTFFQNDGTSLKGVEGGSVDFAFSFDSLVHAERDVIEAYVHELARNLAPDGVGFIHHSNVGRYADPQTHELPFRNIGKRGVTMTAEAFEGMCTAAGLQCVGQEILNWHMENLNDCFSLCARPESRFARPNVVVENPRFMDEAAAIGAIAERYGAQGFPGVPPSTPPAVEPITMPERRAIPDQPR
jgi:SAM-dependent methyltransferase